MSALQAQEVRDYILELFSDSLEGVGVEPQDVTDEFDLLTEGVIDSLGILEMVASLEERFSLRLDFEGLTAEDLTRIGPLSQYVEQLSQSAQ